MPLKHSDQSVAAAFDRKRLKKSSLCHRAKSEILGFFVLLLIPAAGFASGLETVLFATLTPALFEVLPQSATSTLELEADSWEASAGESRIAVAIGETPGGLSARAQLSISEGRSFLLLRAKPIDPDYEAWTGVYGGFGQYFSKDNLRPTQTSGAGHIAPDWLFLKCEFRF